MNLEYIVSGKFDAAHKLENYRGKCANLHGHCWKYKLCIEFNSELDKLGIGIDFKLLKRITNRVDETFDHKLIGIEEQTDGREDAITVIGANPTAENISISIIKIAQRLIDKEYAQFEDNRKVTVKYIELAETDDNVVKVYSV